MKLPVITGPEILKHQNYRSLSFHQKFKTNILSKHWKRRWQ